MKNCFAGSPQRPAYLDGPRYLDALARALGDPLGSPQRLQALGSATQDVWSSFNTQREPSNFHSRYLDGARGDAYLASFLIPNAERVFSVLSAKGKSACAGLLRQRELRICDYGCGPWSATVGALSALGALSQGKLPRLQISGVDRSLHLPEVGLGLLQESLCPGAEVELERLSALPPQRPGEGFHIILLANVLNELPPPARLGLLTKLARRLLPGGILLVLEPGQDEHAWALSRLRNRFLEAVPALALLGPCPHRGPCPLTPEAGRKDWCWFSHRFEVPPLLRAVDSVSGLSHQYLGFSYLLLGNGPQGAREFPPSVAVSEPIDLGILSPRTSEHVKRNLLHGTKEEALLLTKGPARKQLLCTREGRLAARLLAPSQRPRRGDEISPRRGEVWFQERSAPIGSNRGRRSRTPDASR